jgi:hypothetical protein
MAQFEVLSSENEEAWQAVVEEAVQCDFYHLPAYHRLAEERGEGKARLFVYREGDHLVALPLLLRPIGELPWHVPGQEVWLDATCVYGYAGPISSGSEIPESVRSGFRSALAESLERSGVVSVFSRLHPLIPHRGLLAGLGECVPVGKTVSIDLTLPIEVQRSHYRKDYKRQINRLRRVGVVFSPDPDTIHLNDFIDIYRENMRRVEAEEYYFFDRGYFRGLLSALGADIHLFHCTMDDEILCGGLFTSCDGIVQAHLVGSRAEYLELSPIKLLFDGVRLWANEQGATALHLGGGVGGREDSLFHFKTGFSKRAHEFAVWKWVILPDVYKGLVEERVTWARQQGQPADCDEYFPGYRCARRPEIDHE